jgi:hypothetical protein
LKGVENNLKSFRVAETEMGERKVNGKEKKERKLRLSLEYSVIGNRLRVIWLFGNWLLE